MGLDFTYGLLGVLVTLLLGFIVYFRWSHNYWKRKGVKTIPPSIPFGNMSSMFIGDKSLTDIIKEIYGQYKSEGLKHAGIYMFSKPIYMPIDLDLVKRIMQTDFEYFPNHGGYVNEEGDPLSAHLFALRDDKWKNLRMKLTPTFTSSKMRMMFQTLVDCTDGLKALIDENIENRTPLDIKEVLARFTTDVIGSCAFGIECNSMKDANSEFRRIGQLITRPSRAQHLRNIIQGIAPEELLKMINFKILPQKVEDFLMDIVKNTIEYREKNQIYRKDFLQLLIQIKNTGQVTDGEYITTKTPELHMTLGEIAAQCYIFFLAGFETSSSTNSFVLYELATNRDIQVKLRHEINTVLKKHGGELTYDALKEMIYMDKVIYESLRKYSPLPATMRMCSKEYAIPGTSIVLEKGTPVFIPLAGIHNDPEYYPEPEHFDPERFSDAKKCQRHPFAWLAFGEGPRICIGQRFGMMQAKVGLATIIKNYDVSVNNRTISPIKFDQNSFVVAVKNGVWLDMKKISYNDNSEEQVTYL